MLRTFLAYSAIEREDASGQPKGLIDGNDVKAVVQRLFTVYPTPDGASDVSIAGTPKLRGTTAGKVDWLSNETYRGSFVDYPGPDGAGRVLFMDEDWHKPLKPNALQTVQNSRADGETWPPRDVLSVIALCNEPLDSTRAWQDIVDHAREKFRLDTPSWEAITSESVLGALNPFGGPEWDPANLSEELRPKNAPPRRVSGKSGGTAQSALIQEQTAAVVDALERFGHEKFIALAGVPGTGKSYVGRLAAEAFADPGCVRRIQFSPGYPYEEFVEGPRFDDNGRVIVEPGSLMAINDFAHANPTKKWVLFIEEFTRADLSRVLGELLTFIEYRNEEFFTIYTRRKPVRLAKNLAFLATYNPTDRSAVAVDGALLRRMEVIDFPPRIDLLRDILKGKISPAAIRQLERVFERCQDVAGERFEEVMPFGHASFAGVTSEADLHRLWEGQLRRILVRPNAPKHELFDAISEEYPWRSGPAVEVALDVASDDPDAEQPPTSESAPAAAEAQESGEPPAGDAPFPEHPE